ncbi:lipocalin family protein [Chryseobacterium rhizoplanae]|uniref:lipocalin family protein n=1 Tax=Chryseobacterium rhizoplanae TaxID=1609531 RepID=UPI001CE382FF|nr:lipocalin family protein [Chryseobacterium rhizoplanae]UCA61813.1 lipocalin family protein [Chryseobacterium rhizoplanae]
MKKQAILCITLGILSSCNPSSQNKGTDASTDQTINRGNLLGKWLQPIPGMENEKQGFELFDNGIAASLNIHTLQYDKWTVAKDTLFMWYHTEGVKQVSSGIDTLLIQKLDSSNLIIGSPNAKPEDFETYSKEK